MLEPGQVFADRYRVIRQLAEGGMGAIFEAQHVATERNVALKLLFPHIMSMASARKKFELEAKVSARVNSPFIVAVLDAGFDERTRSPFLVMELLAGQTVTDYVESRGALTADEALPLLEQVADGLDAAHGYSEGGVVKPIVHRDLKPDNLFMARERGSFVIKILDFGIAKVLGETSNVSQEVRGTPLYMATEQITAGELSPQTDVWALGLIAYYMLTGKNYWRSANQEAANMQSLFAEILTLPIESPSLRLREVESNVALPPKFDAWFSRCVDRAPSRRYASAGVAIEELARAFRRTPRMRTRPSTRAAQSFAATEAAVVPAAVKRGVKSATAASLPGMASEHQSLAGVPRSGDRRPWWIGAAVAAALGLGIGVVRLSAGSGDEPAAALPSAEKRSSGVSSAADPAPAEASSKPRADEGAAARNEARQPQAAGPAVPAVPAEEIDELSDRAITPSPAQPDAPPAGLEATAAGSPAPAPQAAKAKSKKIERKSRGRAKPKPPRRRTVRRSPAPAAPPPKLSTSDAYRLR